MNANLYKKQSVQSKILKSMYTCVILGITLVNSTKYVNKQSKCKPFSEGKCTVKDAEILVNKCYFGYNTA